MGSEGDEPHVERYAEKGDWEEDTKKTEFAKPHRTLAKMLIILPNLTCFCTLTG